MSKYSQIAFVCCVESGALENYTLRMIESLRRWGGRFSNSPIFAVTPRFSPPISTKTRDIFNQFQVQYIYIQNANKYSWNKFFNKPAALATVEKIAKTECIGWLDSDLLIVNEPSELTINQTESFLACAPDKNIGTTGIEDPNEPYWQEICKCVGIDIDELPWIKTEEEGALIRLYWNSGIFVYRRSTNFAEEYLRTCIKLFDAQIASQESGIFFNDQVALGLTMVKMKLPWRALPYSHNFNLSSHTFKSYDEEKLRAAKVLHYHDGMWPPYWVAFIESLCETHPSATDWLTDLGPMKNEAPIYCRATRIILDKIRSRQQQAYIKSCRVI